MNTINNFLNEVGSLYGIKPAFKFLKDGEIKEKSYMQLNSDSSCFASYLFNKYGSNKHMAIISPTSYEWFVAYFGITKSQNVAVTLDYTLDVETLCEMINFADVEFLFISEKFKHLINTYKDNCENLKVIFIMETDLEDYLLGLYRMENDFDDNTVAQIIFTSGTTGVSKAAMLTHKNITSLYYFNATKFNPDAVSLSVLPVHHVAELVNNILYMLMSGGTICINDKIENMMKNMQVFKPSTILVVPLIFNKFAFAAVQALKEANVPDEYLLSKSFAERRRIFKNLNDKVFGGNMNTLMVGGSAMDIAAARTLEKVGFFIKQGYGLTETASIVVGNETHFQNLDNCGRIVRDDSYVKVEDGELLVKGPNVMFGYYKDEESTRQVFTEDGFFRTGDLAEIDENGYVKILGRKKDLIILDNGENVSPEELQMKIARIPGAVMNIVYSSKNTICCAILETKENALLKNSIKEGIDRLNTTFPAYKKITKVNFIHTPFVLTAKNSIKRKETIENIIKELKNDEVVVPPRTEVEKVIYDKILKFVSSDIRFGIQDNIFDLGVDSLQILELAAELNLNAQDIYDAKTIENIAKISVDKYKSKPVDDNINEIINSNSELFFDNNNDNYFITGTTGFFGAYVLNILAGQNKNIYCLVRDKEKLEYIYNAYFNSKLPDNIKIYIGDIKYKDLGLSTFDYNYLLKNVDNVIHAAAIVKHIGSKQEFIDTNINGTKNIIAFAKNCNAVLNYISSYSVSGFGLTKQKNTDVVFDENVLNIGQDYEQNVYVYTKYLAEKEVLLARKEGLYANIYRIGSLTWDKRGVFQVNEEDNGFINRLNGLRKTKKYLADHKDCRMDFTPVDECANAFILLMQNKKVNNIYHLFNPYVLTVDELGTLYNEEYAAMNKEDFKRITKETDDKIIKFYIDYELFTYPFNSNLINCKKTLMLLKSLNFEWSIIDKTYLNAFI